jgi:uncharacterized membrane protein YfhO
VLSEPYTSGWTAEVDGNPVDLLIANHAFRAVPVTAGEHIVAFAYHPISLRWGARISIMAMAILLFIPVLWRAPIVHAERPGHTNELERSGA